MIHKEQSQLVVVTNVTRKNFICNAYVRVGIHFDQIHENVSICIFSFIRETNTLIFNKILEISKDFNVVDYKFILVIDSTLLYNLFHFNINPLGASSPYSHTKLG